jgi:TRAP-type uncharacterized transport system substrate-binding protein
MHQKIARIIAEQVANGDQATVDALRNMAGMPVREVQERRHFVRIRVMDIQRDQFGKILGSHEHIEEHEAGDSFSAWSR